MGSDPAGRGVRWSWRRVALGAVASAILAVAGRAQTVGVVLTAPNIPQFDLAVEGLRKASGAELGVESLDADASRWPKVREKLSKKPPSAWVAVGPLALKEMAASGTSGPLVFMMVATPAKSLPADAHGVAGVTMRLGIDVQLKELKALLPAVKRLGVLYDPANSANDVKEADKVAGALGMQLVTATMVDVRELGSALKTLLEQKIDALWLLADPTVTPPGNNEAFEYVAANTLQAGVPVVGYAEKLTQGGALLSIGPDYADIGKQAGEMVKAILAGSSPDQVGIQNARKAALTINKKVAATLGVELPAEAQARAVQVFQ